MRPILKSGLCRVWLDRDTLQLGIGPRRRVLHLDTASRCMIEALDGTRDTAALLSYGERLGLTAQRAAGLLDRLALDGALDDAALPTPGLARLSVNERARLAPVVSALGLRNRLPGGGPRALERRAQQYAAVHGLGLVGAQVARHLAAAGVGAVRPVDPSRVEHADTGPGAHDPADVGRRRQDAVARAIQRLTPAARIAPAAHSRPDLVIVTSERYPAELLENLAATGLPHLAVRMTGDSAMVGPLVLPGRTPCVRCADLHQSENDPSWPRYLAHLGPPRSGELPPRDTPLVLSAVACTVQTALSFLDGDEPAALGGVLYLEPDAHTAVRIELPPHPACNCGACGDALAAYHRLPSPRDFVHGELLE